MRGNCAELLSEEHTADRLLRRRRGEGVAASTTLRRGQVVAVVTPRRAVTFLKRCTADSTPPPSHQNNYARISGPENASFAPPFCIKQSSI